MNYVNPDRIDGGLVCLVCLQPFTDPVEIPGCRHLIDSECLVSWLLSRRCCGPIRGECPACRSEFGKFTSVEELRASLLPAHPFIYNQLDALNVICPSCNLVLQRQHLATHQRTCCLGIVILQRVNDIVTHQLLLRGSTSRASKCRFTRGSRGKRIKCSSKNRSQS